MYALQCMVSFEDVYNCLCLYSLFFWENTQKGRVIFCYKSRFLDFENFSHLEKTSNMKKKEKEKNLSPKRVDLYIFLIAWGVFKQYFFLKELYICIYRVLSGQVFFEKGGIPR